MKRAASSGFPLLVVGIVCCGLACHSESKKKTEGAEAEAEEDPSNMMSSEVVFDPKNPPPGFSKCHRNHCHRVGGGVASYAQVMEEIGATRAINVPKPKPMPAAPSDVAAAPADAIKTESGLAMKVLTPGNGANPTTQNTVVIHYTAWTTAGKGFDSSVARGEPSMIPLAKLSIKGLAEALLLMSPGEERRVWMPPQLAFEGKRGRPQGMVVFDVKLLEVL